MSAKTNAQYEASLLLSNSFYLETLKILRISATLLPFLIVPMGLLSKYGITDNQFYAGDNWLIGIGVGFFVVALFQFYVLGRWPLRRNYLIFSVIYHVLSTLFVLFVCGVVQVPGLIIWIVLTMAVDIYFGNMAFWLNSLLLSCTILLALWMHPELASNQQVIALLNGVMIVTTTFIYSRLRAVNDRTRLALLRAHKSENLQHKRLLALINSMGDAVVTTNSTGNIQLYNSALLSLLDTNTGLAGKNVNELLKLVTAQKETFNIIHEAKKHKTMFRRTDLEHIFDDGEVLKLYINVAPIHPGYRLQPEHGYIFIIRDITKEKSLEEERDEFISVISHELRTPVAIAEGNLSNIKLLEQHKATQSMVDKAVNEAHNQILYLSKLINDLGALSRAERGVGKTPQTINLKTFLSEIYDKYAPQAKERGLILHASIAPDLPDIQTSQLYLEEIIQNLITNAIKYTKQGSVTLDCHQDSKGVVNIIVKDTGIGIGKSDHKHIFEKFYRSEDYRTRESNGTGLGLYVSQKLASKMGIKLDFESRLNHGSTFTLSIKPTDIVSSTAPSVADVIAK